MIDVELQTPESLDTNVLARVVEDVCAANHLICTLKGTLAGYPGSIHWHFKKGMQKGVLEITWWETEHCLWFKVAENRTGQWIEDSIPRVKQQIEASPS